MRALAPRYDACMQACTCARTWYRAATQRAGPPPRGAEARLPANLTLGGYFKRGMPQDVVADTLIYNYLTGRGFYFEGASKWFVTGSACGSRRISWQPPRERAGASPAQREPGPTRRAAAPCGERGGGVRGTGVSVRRGAAGPAPRRRPAPREEGARAAGRGRARRRVPDEAAQQPPSRVAGG